MAAYAPWISYPPAIGGLTLGNGVSAGWYKRDGTTLRFNFRITAGTTSANGAGAWTVGLPAGMTSAAGRSQWFQGNLYDSSANLLWDLRWRTLPSVAVCDAWYGNAAATTLAPTTPITIGVSDLIEGGGLIEILP